MKNHDFKSLSVLIVSAKPHVVQILRQVMGIAGVGGVAAVADGNAALELLANQIFDAVFCDDASANDTGVDFGAASRKSEGMLDPMLPVFLLCAGPRRRDIETARDQGYTDVLTRPVSAATIMRKLKLAVERPRPFIVAPDFYGPDRRAESRGQFRGPDRRKRTPRKVRIAAAGEA
ncbi:MAG TPA: response regulator [Rhizomicrobium sp.]|jgi:CheY-like chemotaxis protein